MYPEMIADAKEEGNKTAERSFVYANEVEQVRSFGADGALNYDPALPAHIKSDPYRLRQVLVNLLSNAVKFTAEGQVTLRASETPRDFLRFEVADTGVGMTAVLPGSHSDFHTRSPLSASNPASVFMNS